MTSKRRITNLSHNDIYRKAAEIQQRMYDEWDEEAIERIAQELMKDGKTK